ncbi:hypothetical protein [Acidovorax sp. BLS4]|uniref:hypothetical protein n=1 Tax=Acidovorax sp. BLS4 TaxID=3273430 RepID=UPI002942702F|nr:hypothetical protein [Paracidovorax avenae]WOI45553.1 hypothetical protein R1Z03_24180 [Paracidovorax avenae]
MKNQVLTLPLQNERLESIKVVLEPLSEYFIIKPGQHVEVHAIFDGDTSHLSFTVAPNDSFLTIYAPGEIAGFVDCYMTCNGVRLQPDGN